MSTIMGEKWKNVSEEERKPYEDRYKVEKDVYLKVHLLTMYTVLPQEAYLHYGRPRLLDAVHFDLIRLYAQFYSDCSASVD
jgi:hypothetical protein